MIDPESGMIDAAVVHAIREEFARTVTDVAMRRTMVGYSADIGVEAAPAIAGIAVAGGLWSESEAADSLADYLDYITRFLPQALATAAD